MRAPASLYVCVSESVRLSFRGQALAEEAAASKSEVSRANFLACMRDVITLSALDQRSASFMTGMLSAEARGSSQEPFFSFSTRPCA
eukprot:6185866-Pleurochrysis_carterae.AAC.2